MQFVDDIRQSHSAPSTSKLANRVSHTCNGLASGLIGLGCKISTKTIVLSSSAEIGQAICRRVKNIGIPVKLKKIGKDLGVVTCAGVRRYSSIVKQRVTKAKLRTRRIKVLAKAVNKAKHLFNTGAFSQGSYAAVTHL